MKIDFPIGVELPLRGDGVAVLYEYIDGLWRGRYRSDASKWPTYGKWNLMSWQPNGHIENDGEITCIDILPPKRKAWVVWRINGTVAGIWTNKKHAIEHFERHVGMGLGHIQEITEP